MEIFYASVSLDLVARIFPTMLLSLKVIHKNYGTLLQNVSLNNKFFQKA